MRINVGLTSFVILIALVCSVFGAVVGGSMIQYGDLQNGVACVAIALLCLGVAWEFSHKGYSQRQAPNEFTTLMNRKVKVFNELQSLQIQNAFLHIDLKRVQASIRDGVDISEPESFEAEEELIKQRILANQKRIDLLDREFKTISKRMEEGPV